jgi:hypothetical protein
MGEDHICPDCQASMEEGYLPDRGYAYTNLTRWYPGRPVLGVFGIKGFVLGEPCQGLLVTTYRCPKCGFLMSYAK